jgi:methylmalonyl-CoA mutase
MSPSDPLPSSFPSVSYETWRSRVEAELGADSGPRLRRETLEGIEVEALYSADHLAEALPARFAPSGTGWRTWHEVPVSGGAAARAALGREADRELGGVWLRLDDSVTAARAAAILGGAVARAGVEVAVEWAGEPLASAALIVAAAQQAGSKPERLGGCLGCDPLGALARRGTLSGSACEQTVAAARWAAAHAPGMRAALVSTAPYADAGAEAVQEIAFALATGAQTLRSLLDAGLTPAEAASQILVSLTVGRDLYLQAAKLRAMRLTWGMLLASVDAPPDALRLHARTAWRTKGHRDPGTDLVRATVETFAAVLGGADDVTTSPLLDADEELALGMPLGSATQLLLREEVGLDRVADAAGGSWYVESLTAMLARRAWEIFEGIERRGGMARELAVGAIAQQVAAAAERRRRALAEKALAIVGVTLHPPKQPAPLPHRPLVVAPESNVRAADGGAATAVASWAGEPDSPALFAAAVDAAVKGATVAALAAAVPQGQAALRAPALVAWRDAEPFESTEATA